MATTRSLLSHIPDHCQSEWPLKGKKIQSILAVLSILFVLYSCKGVGAMSCTKAPFYCRNHIPLSWPSLTLFGCGAPQRYQLFECVILKRSD